MATLLEDIKKQSDWIIKAFKADGMDLDYSIGSLMEIDRFVQKNAKDGQAIKGGRLSKNLGGIVFSIASYIGETLIKNVPNSKWITDDNDPQGEINITVELGDGTKCWPAQRMIKRIQNGLEDGIYPYGHSLTSEFTNEESDKSFWDIEKDVKPMEPKKPWWKF
jgi:hypothetical protein